MCLGERQLEREQREVVVGSWSVRQVATQQGKGNFVPRWHFPLFRRSSSRPFSGAPPAILEGPWLLPLSLLEASFYCDSNEPQIP